MRRPIYHQTPAFTLRLVSGSARYSLTRNLTNEQTAITGAVATVLTSKLQRLEDRVSDQTYFDQLFDALCMRAGAESAVLH